LKRLKTCGMIDPVDPLSEQRVCQREMIKGLYPDGMALFLVYRGMHIWVRATMHTWVYKANTSPIVAILNPFSMTIRASSLSGFSNGFVWLK